MAQLGRGRVATIRLNPYRPVCSRSTGLCIQQDAAQPVPQRKMELRLFCPHLHLFQALILRRRLLPIVLQHRGWAENSSAGGVGMAAAPRWRPQQARAPALQRGGLPNVLQGPAPQLHHLLTAGAATSSSSSSASRASLASLPDRDSASSCSAGSQGGSTSASSGSSSSSASKVPPCGTRVWCGGAGNTGRQGRGRQQQQQPAAAASSRARLHCEKATAAPPPALPLPHRTQHPPFACQSAPPPRVHPRSPTRCRPRAPVAAARGSPAGAAASPGSCAARCRAAAAAPPQSCGRAQPEAGRAGGSACMARWLKSSRAGQGGAACQARRPETQPHTPNIAASDQVKPRLTRKGGWARRSLAS